jgi:hypothetical protein
MEYKRRLSDRILPALQLAVEQEDADIADLLARALEMSMTRKAGGQNFVERRTFDEEIEDAIDAAFELKNR